MDPKANPYYSNKVSEVGISATAEAANARTVTVQARAPALRTGEVQAITRAVPLRVWLSDAATGIGVAASAPSGGVAIGTKGAVLAAVVAGKVLDCVTDATGALELVVTEATGKTFHVCVGLPDGSFQTFPLVFAA